MRSGSRYSGAIDPLSVVGTIEANVADWLSTLATLVPGARIERHADLTAAVFPLHHALANAVVMVRMSGRGSRQRIAEVTQTYAEAGSPVVWWLGPSTRPVDLPRHLLSQGYAQVETLVGMAADLYRETQAPASSVAMDWREVATRADIADWATPFAEGFGAAEDLIAALAAASGYGMPFADGMLRLFVGYEPPDPVTCLMLHIGGGVAGLYGVSTSARARGRGYASGLVRRALQTARHCGCRTAVLHATPMAVSMYRSLGFVEYCRLRTYTPHSG